MKNVENGDQILFTLSQYSMALTIPKLIYALSVQYGSYCTKSYLRSLSTVWLLLYQILFTLSQYSMALTVPIFTNLSLSERHNVNICSTEFNPIGQEMWKPG